MSDLLYDVVIIGGGPAGLTAALYSARAKLKTIVLDKSPTAGALASTGLIENYPGLEKPLKGKELLDIFRRQALGFGAEYVETQVVGVSLQGEVKEIYTMGDTYQGRTVIITTGSMGRKPTIKGEAEFLGKGVSYCAVCDAPFFKEKTVCVIGHSEEAVKEAEYLTGFAKTIYLISPLQRLNVGDEHPAFLPQANQTVSEKTKNLKVLLGYSVSSIEGGDVVERVRLKDSKGAEISIDTAGVFIYLHGSKPIVDFLQETVETLGDACIVTNKMMETNIPGVFAAGDVTCSGVRQVVVAASEGCVAALSAERYVSHRERRRYDWHK